MTISSPSRRRSGRRSELTCALLAAAVVLGAAAPAVAGRTLYVSPAGKGMGKSKSSPLGAQAALDRAVDGDEIIFLDGTYPSLRLTARDRGNGTITLRAQAPAFERIDTGNGAVVGKSSGGAVIQATGRTGILIDNHDGVVVEGFSFRGGDQQVSLVNTSGARVSHNHFHEASTIGLLIAKQSGAVQASQNLFTNQRKAEGAGWYMDYGIFAEHPGSLTLTGNMIEGRFNQGVSLKQQVTRASIISNRFSCENGACLMLGQEGDLLTGGGALIDRTVGEVDVADNDFVNNGYVPIDVVNVEKVRIDGNRFRDSSNLFRTRYSDSSRTGMRLASGGRLPHSVEFTNNTVEDVDWLFLEGRGTRGDQVTIADNRMVTRLRKCERNRLTHDVAKIATRNPPKVLISKTAINCVRS